MASASAKPDLKSVKSSDESSADQNPSVAIDDKEPLLSKSGDSIKKAMPDSEKKKDYEVGEKSGTQSPTPSTAETVPHPRRQRVRVIPTFSDPARASERHRFSRLSRSEPPIYHWPRLPNSGFENSSQYLGSQEPSPFQSIRNSGDAAAGLGCMQRYTAFCEYVANSYFIIPFLVILIGLSVFACYMGIAYFHQCDFIPDITMMMVIQGVCLAIALIARIVYIVTMKYSTSYGDLRYVTIVGIVVFLIVYIIEFIYYIFPKSHPSTETGPHYCHPFFYNYLFWNNWVALLILIIMVIVHGPVCFSAKSIVESA